MRIGAGGGTGALPWERAAGRSLIDLVPVVPGPGSGNPCHWQLGKLPAEAAEDVEAAAWLVAEEIMRLRTRGATETFDIWRTAATTEGRISDPNRPRVEPFVQTVFGSTIDPAPTDHVEGYVAEVVWFLLTRDGALDHGRTIRRIEEPSFYVTGPGGDGLVVSELEDGTLVFRLWEIKKHNRSGGISATATRAMTQLATRGAGYLAQYVATAPNSDGDVARLYAELVDHWVDAHSVAGAGVGIGTSATSAPKRRCFTTMQSHFPRLNEPGQLEGLVVGIADFAGFSRSVRDFVWSAL